MKFFLNPNSKQTPVSLFPKHETSVVLIIMVILAVVFFILANQ